MKVRWVHACFAALMFACACIAGADWLRAFDVFLGVIQAFWALEER